MRRELNPPLPSRTLRAALDLRANATAAETKLWYHLRARRLDGLKFRRQHPFPPYVADFFCSEAKLVVELDGSQHGDEQGAARTRALEGRGLLVLRFWNNDVLGNTAAVLEVIANSARNRTLSPTPLPAGEGLESAVARLPSPSGRGIEGEGSRGA
jgi:very-short-patch-repair endonuclease